MKVKLNSIYAGPNGSAQPGDIIDVSNEEAAQLFEGRYAVPVPQAVETAEAPVSAAETTDLPEGETTDAPAEEAETTDAVRPRKGKKK